MCSPQVLGLRKSLSRESSDGEIHLRSRQKPCRSASINASITDLAWAAAPNSMWLLPPGLAAHMSMLDLNSLKQRPRSSQEPTRPPSRSLSATSLTLWEQRPTPLVHMVPSQREMAGLEPTAELGELETHRPRVSSACPLAAWAAPVSAIESETAAAAASSHTSRIGSPSLPLCSRVMGAAPFAADPFASPTFLSLPPLSPVQDEPDSAQSSLVHTAFEWHGDCDMVFLAGSFNRWQERIPLARARNRRSEWSVVLSLPIGEYSYKFVVQLACGTLRWECAPDQPMIIDNGVQNNWLLVCDQSEFEVPDEAGDDDDDGYSQTDLGDEAHVIFASEPPPLPRVLQKLPAKWAARGEGALRADAGGTGEPSHAALQHLCLGVPRLGQSRQTGQGVHGGSAWGGGAEPGPSCGTVGGVGCADPCWDPFSPMPCSDHPFCVDEIGRPGAGGDIPSGGASLAPHAAAGPPSWGGRLGPVGAEPEARQPERSEEGDETQVVALAMTHRYRGKFVTTTLITAR